MEPSGTSEESTVCIKDFDMFVTVQVLEDISLAVLSLGRSCVGMDLHLSGNRVNLSIYSNRKRIKCRAENLVPIASGNRSRELPEWLEPFTEGVIEGTSSSSTDTVPRAPPPATLPPGLPSERHR